MRILIDECLDWRLCRALSDHDCVSVQKMGWSGLTNGALLEKAEREFDLFLTGDRNLAFQQKIQECKIVVIILHAASTQLLHTLPLVPKILAVLKSEESGNVIDVYP